MSAARLIGLSLCLMIGVVCEAFAADKDERPVPSIAVLDFVNRAPGDGHDWLGKGLADMVMTDLSVSPRVRVVRRERMQELAHEFELAAKGVLDEETAPRLGRTAHANWVLFGSYRRQEGQLRIEALLIDVDHQKTLRLEQVDGPFNDLFRLERELTQAFLKKLDVTMTAAELDQVERLQTRSLPAFEHYARCLELFDRGLWYDALGEARLARKGDPAYLMAGARVAQLYFEIGDPEHSLVEYERLIELDHKDLLPDSEYFKMANLLEIAFDDDQRVEAVFQRILKRHAAYDVPFRITDPPPPIYEGWASFGGLQKISETFRQHEAYLESLERLARRRLREGKTDDAAKLYSQISRFTWTHGLALTGGAVWSGLNAKVDRHYPGLYWQLMRENRDADFFVPGVPNSFYLLPAAGAEINQSTKPTHGYAPEKPSCWLAPPDYEIAKVEYSLSPHSSEKPKLLDGKNAQIDFVGLGCDDLLSHYDKTPLDGEWHTKQIPPGVRAMKTYIHYTDRYKLRFHLRKWSGNPPVVKRRAWIQVSLEPPVADLYLNGEKRLRSTSGGVGVSDLEPGTYEVEARWDDGRHRSTTIKIEPHRGTHVFLNADLETLTREKIAPSGCQTQLLIDHSGRIWLLWDDSMPANSIMQKNQQADLFCATSLDGVSWTPPRRLPVSSFTFDAYPILQQDRHGTFWLVWVSTRGKETASDRRLWIASSPNGVEWSFPRQIALPETTATAMENWRSSNVISFGFAIDQRNEFWLAAQGYVLHSDDSVTWKTDSILHTVDGGKDNLTYSGKTYHLSVAANNDLLLVDNFAGRQINGVTSMLWRRQRSEKWQPVGELSPPPAISHHAGSAVPQPNGSIVTVMGQSRGVYLREFDATGQPGTPLQISSHANQPTDPSLTVLPDGRYLVVYGTTEGLVASVIQKANLPMLQ
ncbi:MAG: hypothetical protein NT013_31130 [Planctomycetia bacterium]|nr:hypothetical protein [Planctomycetia bacterium]